MYGIIISVVTSLVTGFIFWMIFTKIPEINRYRKIRPIVEYDVNVISMYILFYLQMAFDNHGMRPSVSQNKIKANIFSEEEYNLMLQNKCLNESYLYDENKDYLIPIGNELERLSKKIVKGVENLSFYHNFMTYKEIILLKKIKESITCYSYNDNAKREINGRMFVPHNPTISFMANNFKTINNYFYELNNIIFNYKYLNNDLNRHNKYDLVLEKSRVLYEQGMYKEAYKYSLKSSDFIEKYGMMFKCLYKLGKKEKALVHLERYFNKLEDYFNKNFLRLITLRGIFEDSYNNEEVINFLRLKRDEDEIEELLTYFRVEEELKGEIKEQLYKIKNYYEKN